MSDGDEREFLIRGLVGRDHEMQWHNDARFRASIEVLVTMLPAMVNGLALEADKNQEEQAMRVRELSERNPTTFRSRRRP